ncbi:MAG: hypothetical protein LBN34_00815, partial [Clostridiales Family XIII bacterium]|nr:hypothetical protein [Clostridiales Family XIII bacterium]
QAEYDSIVGNAGGTGLPAIHEDNYLSSDVLILRNAELAAKLVLADTLATQGEVDQALLDLTTAFDTLVSKHNHPLVSHSHSSGLTAFGEEVDIEIKGDIRDVTGVALNGISYPITATGTNTYDIYEDGDVIGNITEGSAIVHLPAEFSDRLANGTHELVVFFSDPTTNINVVQSGKANIVVNREAEVNGEQGDPDGIGSQIRPLAPLTGDDTLIDIMLGLSIVSLSVLLFLMLMRRRKPSRL